MNHLIIALTLAIHSALATSSDCMYALKVAQAIKAYDEKAPVEGVDCCNNKTMFTNADSITINCDPNSSDRLVTDLVVDFAFVADMPNLDFPSNDISQLTNLKKLYVFISLLTKLEYGRITMKR